MAKQIMVVDDEQDIVELVKVILKAKGFDVVTFGNARDAWAELKKGNIPDLVLLDIRMPEMSGNDFCEKVESDKRFKDLKIVVFTASIDLGIAFKEINNVAGFIAKPFDNEGLVKEVTKYLKD
ncbi:MAG: response regulator [Nanoarchaeota archaeon]|nr:response regulator [Nanoarchaeota archaeon]MCK5630425.1 response regulator [Nanoarchaeota archaeon]